MNTSMPTPEIRADVTFHYADGTSICYKNIAYLAQSRVLIFNGENSGITVAQENVARVSVLGSDYQIRSADQSESGNWTMSLIA
jgi:hypothetical protein